MTPDEVRVYFTEAIGTAIQEAWLTGAAYTPTKAAEAVLAVVETLRTPCPNCSDGLVLHEGTPGPILKALGAPDDSTWEPCTTCGGNGQSALLAFDEMRGMEQCAAGLYMGGTNVHRPVYWFPVALLSPDTTETP